jgi:hypothetical protein
MFTKQHYEQVADLLKRAQNKHRGETADQLYFSIIDDFADLFENDNGNFNRDKFSLACGIEPIKD